MAIKVAINGYGRIGRNILRAFYESNRHDDIQIVAINDLGPLQTNVHLTRYDSTHGPFRGEVAIADDKMLINGDLIEVFAERDPAKLPWESLGVDVVFECTGRFTSKDEASVHLKAGAKKVIISAPASGVDATIVFGVNDHILTSKDSVISNASCTTNCLAPLAKPLHEHIGIEAGLMVTVHSYTNDQVLVDSFHSDLYRARSATQSIIPTKTGAASAVGLVLPELNGKLDGYALRVPTVNVSLVDFTFTPKRSTTVAEVDRVLKDAARGPLKNILVVNEEPLVSVDFNHNPASSIYDATQTRVIDNLVKVLAWYDNEWGFSNRMLDVTRALMQAK
jgi:glyceraldehyde 3-phosphate dehydrogenase